MGRVVLGIGERQGRILNGNMLVCNYLTLKFETRVVSLIQICALVSSILDVFLLKCKVHMVVVRHSVIETVLLVYVLQKIVA